MRDLVVSFVLAVLSVVILIGLLGGESELQAQPTFDAGRVTVSTTATLIYTAPPRGASLRICNRHTTPIFIGNASVTTANGFEILNATCEDVTPYGRTPIYGIVAAATARVDYFAHDYPR